MKKSWCLRIEANVKEIDWSFWRSFQDQSYQMITQYVHQSVAIRQSATGQAESQYMLCNVPTVVATSQGSQVPTVPRMSYLAPSAASGSQILIITTEAPTNLSQYSLTDLGNVLLNLSPGAPTLSVIPTVLLEGNR